MPQPGGYGATGRLWRKRKTMAQAQNDGASGKTMLEAQDHGASPRPCRKPKTMAHGKNHAAE
jgi:hypothetical protein